MDNRNLFWSEFSQNKFWLQTELNREFGLFLGVVYNKVQEEE